MDRVELLNEITAGRAALEAALTPLTPAQMTETNLPGGWSVKDLLAHLAWWQRRVVMIYQALKGGVRPETVLINGTVDELNARVLAESRADDLESVRESERQAYLDLLAIAETALDEELFGPHTYSWTGGRPFSDWIAGDTYEHYAEHLPALQGKLAEQAGDLRSSSLLEDAAPAEAEDLGRPRLNPVIERAKAFLDAEGREIDRSRFDFHFGTLIVEDLLGQLGRYQKDDGGFSGLEVDIQAPVSNPFATELALQAMTWASLSDSAVVNHPVLSKTLIYLETGQQEDGTWRFSQDVYKHGLAPWFAAWRWPNLNPTCSIAGALKQLGVGSDQLHSRVQALFESLARPSDLLSDEFYSVLPYAGYLQTEWDLPQADLYRWGVVWWLLRQQSNNPAFSATQFFELAPRPDLAIASRLPAQVIEDELQKLLSDQSEDGGWPTPYDPRWRPWITVNNLLVLRAYGKV